MSDVLNYAPKGVVDRRKQDMYPPSDKIVIAYVADLTISLTTMRV